MGTPAQEEGTVVSENAHPYWADPELFDCRLTLEAFLYFSSRSLSPRKSGITVVTGLVAHTDFILPLSNQTPLIALVRRSLLSILYLLMSGFPGTDLIPHYLVTTLIFGPHPLPPLPTISPHHDCVNENLKITEEAQRPSDMDVLYFTPSLPFTTQFTAIYFSLAAVMWTVWTGCISAPGHPPPHPSSSPLPSLRSSLRALTLYIRIEHSSRCFRCTPLPSFDIINKMIPHQIDFPPLYHAAHRSGYPLTDEYCALLIQALFPAQIIIIPWLQLCTFPPVVHIDPDLPLPAYRYRGGVGC